MKFNISSINPQNIKKGLNYIKYNGLGGVMSRVRYKMSGPGSSYNGWYKNKHEADADELERERETVFDYEPLISILVPVYMTPDRLLCDMIESVCRQTYRKWQLCIVDGSPALKTVGEENTNLHERDGVIFERTYSRNTERIINQYMEKDDRINYRLLDENLGISENTNRALEMAEGEYIALLDHDDMLTEDALYHIVKALQEERFDALYSDEDKISEDGTKYSDPALKPDFSPDLLRAHNYITHFFVVKRSLALGVGGFHREFDGAQDYDFILRCSENAVSIRHIPRVLYHWRINSASVAADPHMKEYAREAGKLALAEHLKRMGYYATASHTEMWGIYKVIYETPGNPFLSIIITGGRDAQMIKKCITSLYEKSRYSNFEIIIVDYRGSDNPELAAYYHKLGGLYKNIRVMSYTGADGMSGMRNYGASMASGDYLLFMDGNMEIMDASSIGEMLGICMRGDDVGAVGGTIYTEKNIICHEGIAVGVNGLFTFLYQGLRKGDFGYLMHNRVNANYSAVSALCMMVKKSLFDKVGGFSDKFKTELSDIDFCLRLRELNRLIVCAADSGWCYHIPELSGAVPEMNMANTDKDSPLIKQEENLFRILWANILYGGDPYYNSNFTRDGEPFTF